MPLSRLPEPDREVLARSGAIIKALEQLLGADAVISEEEGRRAFEADALTAYRRIPLAVVLGLATFVIGYVGLVAAASVIGAVLPIAALKDRRVLQLAAHASVVLGLQQRPEAAGAERQTGGEEQRAARRRRPLRRPH